ncbi:ankyrin repeat domain-containing protein [Actinoplanes xinjiangensis]|uniref:ankyrin repeat domain-containing protein n=1 Tax=Actinoplanes xinjiangensis TaxID=512350 RepID=UPI003438A96D
MSGHDPLALAEWQRIRRYAVPQRMITECAAARQRGDRRAAWTAGRIDVTGAAAELTPHLAPDLLRWHLPRALGGYTTLAVDQRYVLVPAGAAIDPETEVPVLDALSSMFGSQRLSLGTARWGELNPAEVSLLPAHLWDARHADELRTAIGGSAGRAPGFTADGAPLPAEALGRGDDPASRAERVRLAPPFAEAFAEAGFVVGDEPGVPWPGYPDETTMRSVDPTRLADHVRRFARQFSMSTWMLWLGYPAYLRFDVDGATVRVTPQTAGGHRYSATRGLPRLLPDLVRYQVDLDLIRAGRITPAEVHPMVRAALFPGAPAAAVVPAAGTGPASAVVRESVAGPAPAVVPASVAGPVTAVVGDSVVGGSASSEVCGSVAGSVSAGASDLVAVPVPVAVVGVVRVRCRGDWHEIGVRLGRLDLVTHTDTERQRERALSAFGGTVSGCFAAEQAWHGAPGRLPRRLRAHREDLWQLMIHGGTRTVLELLDAGMDPHLRDSRGRTLMHRMRSFDHSRLLPRLLAEGVDINGRDKEGSTPLYLAVVHEWPAGLIIALTEAGADPHLPNQDDMSVIDHCDEILDYQEDLDPDFEAAVAHLRKRST